MDFSITTMGIGFGQTPGCFVCGGESGMYPCLFAKTANAKEVAGLFTAGAVVGSGSSPSDVKIGSCDGHRFQLYKLNELLRRGTIRTEMIQSVVEK